MEVVFVVVSVFVLVCTETFAVFASNCHTCEWFKNSPEVTNGFSLLLR